MTFLIALFTRWGLPEWVRKPLAYAAAIVAMIALLSILKGCYDRSIERDYEAEITAQVQAQASEAAADATEAVVETKREVESVNKRARDGAAAKPNDPLKGALDAMGDKR